MKRALAWAAGTVFLLIGLIGLLVPVLPGWVFIFVGLSILSPRFGRWARKKIEVHLLKHPVIFLPEWNAHGVTAGFTTARFPLFLKGTGDLLAPERREELSRSLDAAFAKAGKAPFSSGGFVFLEQVHSGRVALLRRDGGGTFSGGWRRLEATDGLVTDIPGLTLLVMTADCLPVFFRARSAAGSVPRAAVGLVHAGWRGTKERIAVKAYHALREGFGFAPAEIEIFFGPGICGKCYEVGEEFAQHFPVRSRGSKTYFDLVLENRRQLHEAGAKRTHMASAGLCTYEGRSFHSYRRSAASAGRGISFIRSDISSGRS